MDKNVEEKNCETCEHEGDSSQEYCGTCFSGVESSWKRATYLIEEELANVIKERDEAEARNRLLIAEIKKFKESQDINDPDHPDYTDPYLRDGENQNYN